MFYDRFVELCSEKKVSRTKACLDCGVSRTAWHKWEEGATPNGITVASFAKYFGVSADYLVGNVSEPYFYLDNDRILADINSYETEKAPTLTEKDRRNDKNILRIAGRDGSYQERHLTDEQMAALKAILAQMPDAPEDL